MSDHYGKQVRGRLADMQRELAAAEQRVQELSANCGQLDDAVQAELARAEQAAAERDGAYRERAQLLAWLASLHPAVLVPAPDVDEPGWQILYLTAGGHQLSWHIHPRDADLYTHVQQVPADDPSAQWDGHSTAEKYQRIRQLASLPALVRLSVRTEQGWRPVTGVRDVRFERHPQPPRSQRTALDYRRPALDHRRLREQLAGLLAARTVALNSRALAGRHRATVDSCGLLICCTHPIEQVAAEPHTLAALMSQFERVLDRSGPPWCLSSPLEVAFSGIPLVPDGSLPPGEVHLRPVPRPASGGAS